ncbi:Fibrinogen-like protein A [Holothuria leucospilota]|uniref:Fibrinogen-like protein A n=1 Tax=Holothuria leucospilota TaxID=206669 RepID=A0A9Q1BVR4_HOLLE|nr:Fibrinogen-like protein A [Holothuria leucospilota]
MVLLFQLNIIVSFVIFFWASSTALSEESGPSYFFYQEPEYPRDCKEVRDSCNTQISNGVFLIKPDGYHKPFEVYCDNDSESGGWTVIQRRLDGSLIFQREWREYKVGFGFLSQEYWIGNEKLSFLTNQNTYELRIDFTLFDGSSFYIAYSLFRIGDEFNGYTLTHLGFFSGRANITNCSNNKDYIPCTCERSCEHPDVCIMNCTEDETCICPNGFYLKGEECVQLEDCGCFLDGNIIPVIRF